MWKRESYIKQIFDPKLNFDLTARQLWQYQASYNPIVRTYLTHMGTNDFTYIPIEFFKAFELKTGSGWTASHVFESSGTSGYNPSRHFVRDISLYQRIVCTGFEHFFSPQSYRILALLPSYLERGNSSLVHMVKTWMDRFGLPGCGFYLYNFEALTTAITEAICAKEPLILIGVTFALLDFVDQCPIELPDATIVIETGGMKGRGEEPTRADVHQKLQKGFQLERIYSEYGMTELMSQAYAIDDGRFYTPPWMQITVRDIHLTHMPVALGSTGRICITDLGNVDSCGFIATDDLGRRYEDGSVEILGRIDRSELRGCSLLYE